MRGTTEDVSLTYALDDISEAVIVKNCSTSTDDEYMRLGFGNGGLDYVSDVKPAADLFDDIVLAHYAGDVVVWPTPGGFFVSSQADEPGDVVWVVDDTVRGAARGCAFADALRLADGPRAVRIETVTQDLSELRRGIAEGALGLGEGHCDTSESFSVVMGPPLGATKRAPALIRAARAFSFDIWLVATSWRSAKS